MSRGRRYARLALLAAATAAAPFALAPAAVADEPPPPPKLVVEDAAGSEGGTAEFTVRLLSASDNEVKVSYATVGNTAAEGADYVRQTGELTFSPGSPPQTVSVPLVDDTLDEDSETFRLDLSDPINADVERAEAVGTIADGDPEPSISVDDAGIDEGNVGESSTGFRVTLSAASGKTVRVRYATAPQTATTDEDFLPAVGTVAFAPGDTEEVVEVRVKGDTTAEADETFQLNLTDPENAGVADPQAVGTIRNDDQPPAISIADADADEGDGAGVELSFTVSLDVASGQTVTVVASTSDGTATAPADYSAKSQVLSFDPGQTTKTFRVSVAGDTLDEPDEFMQVALSEATGGATIADGEAMGRIVDHDSTSLLSVSDATASEPSSGTAVMTFSVTLAPASARPVRVGYTTADGTATAPTDYTAAAGFVEFAPGETAKSVTVAIQADTLSEPNETLFLNLGGADGARVGDEQGLGTIGDKSAQPSLAISDVIAQEGEGATLVVTLTGSTAQTVTVRFSTVDGVATAPADYLPRSGTLTFAPGEQSKSIAVTVTDDTAAEPDEAFAVGIEDAVSATIVKSRGQVLILASDRAPAGSDDPAGPIATPRPTVNRPLNPRMVLSPRTVVVTRTGVARLQLSCLRTSPLTCRGSVALETVAGRKRVLGRAPFTARPGRRVAVNVKLTPYARNLLAKRRSLRVRVRMTIRAGSRVLRVSPGLITLKAPRDDISVPVR